MTSDQKIANMITNLTGLIDGADDDLGTMLQEVVDHLKHQPTLKIVRCDEHDYRVVYLDSEVVCQNDYSVENLYRLAKHLGWSVERETLGRNEFERRYA